MVNIIYSMTFITEQFFSLRFLSAQIKCRITNNRIYLKYGKTYFVFLFPSTLPVSIIKII